MRPQDDAERDRVLAAALADPEQRAHLVAYVTAADNLGDWLMVPQKLCRDCGRPVRSVILGTIDNGRHSSSCSVGRFLAARETWRGTVSSSASPRRDSSGRFIAGNAESSPHRRAPSDCDGGTEG